jgi:hypothetical protein
MGSELTGMGLQRRRPGKGAGCSCCSFTMLGLLTLPLLAVVAFFVVI